MDVGFGYDLVVVGIGVFFWMQQGQFVVVVQYVDVVVVGVVVWVLLVVYVFEVKFVGVYLYCLVWSEGDFVLYVECFYQQCVGQEYCYVVVGQQYVDYFGVEMIVVMQVGLYEVCGVQCYLGCSGNVGGGFECVLWCYEVGDDVQQQ